MTSQHGIVGLDQRFWDDLYGSAEKVWSGRANQALVTEVTGMTPGRALDVGCGEGGDAQWLVRQGWQVTAVDISRVALDRAAALAGDLGITWQRLDLLTEAPAETYDLVSAQYFVFARGEKILEHVLSAVAPGGTLLVTSHAGDGHNDQFYRTDEIADRLGDEWEVLVHEERSRDVATYGHIKDVVLRARRR